MGKVLLRIIHYRVWETPGTCGVGVTLTGEVISVSRYFLIGKARLQASTELRMFRNLTDWIATLGWNTYLVDGGGLLRFDQDFSVALPDPSYTGPGVSLVMTVYEAP